MKDPQFNGLGGEFRALGQHLRQRLNSAARYATSKANGEAQKGLSVPKSPLESGSGPAPLALGIANSLPEVYYDGGTKDYYRPNSSGGYVRVGASSIATHLLSMGYSAKVPKEDLISPLDKILLRIQTEHDLHYVAPLAGWRAGFYTMENSHVLVTSSPNTVVPVAGNWPLIKHVGENLFGEVQWPYVLSWIKLSLDMYLRGIWQAGQAFVMCGAKGSGKNLFMQILLALFGGRAGDPYQYMTGATSFNHDMFGSELLVIEDKAESINIQARRSFGAHIKNITVNELQRHHPKYGNGRILRPLWRVGISLNDDPERLLVLPPIDPDIEDKIMLFKVFKHPMPMPTKTPALKRQFEDAWRAEIPAFAHFLINEWEVPEHLQCDRFGVEAYHHPDLLAALECTTPQETLLELVDAIVFGGYNAPPEWSGRAQELERLLRASHVHKAEVDRILTHSNSCGAYLGRLEHTRRDRISRRMLNGNTIWTIRRVGPAKSFFKPLPDPKSPIIARIRERLAKAKPKLQLVEDTDM